MEIKEIRSMGDMLNKLKRLLASNVNTVAGYNEILKNISVIIKELVKSYNYVELKELIYNTKYGKYITIDIYLNKEDLTDIELLELKNIILDENISLNKAIEMCKLNDDEYIEMLTYIFRNVKYKEYSDISKNRLYELLHEVINIDNTYIKNYNNNINYCWEFERIFSKILNLCTEYSELEKRHKLFESLLNREDIMNYLFMWGLHENNWNLIDMEWRYISENESEIEVDGIYFASIYKINFTDDNLMAIYDRYKTKLFNKKCAYYYSNSLIFIDFINDEEKIELINNAIENDRYIILKKIYKYDKFRKFLDTHIDFKDKIEAYLIMQKLV